jgi:hypothetical protein
MGWSSGVLSRASSIKFLKANGVGVGMYWRGIRRLRDGVGLFSERPGCSPKSVHAGEEEDWEKVFQAS